MNSQQVTFFDFENPLAGYDWIAVNDLEDRLLDENVFFIADNERANKLVLFSMKIAVFEQFTIVDVKNRVFLWIFILFSDYESLICDFACG